MQWRACCAHVSTYQGRLELLVRRLAQPLTIHHLDDSPARPGTPDSSV
jgi:hypothetical protein